MDIGHLSPSHLTGTKVHSLAFIPSSGSSLSAASSMVPKLSPLGAVITSESAFSLPPECTSDFLIEYEEHSCP